MRSAPSFWYQKSKSPLAMILWPLSLIWRFGAWIKTVITPSFQPEIPVVVIGNLTAGGTGKTPLVASLAHELARKSRRPVILTRGHGGQQKAPHLASPDDSANDIGDEAKWLMAFAPVVIARHRGDGARFIAKHLPECDVIIMDDGLQNPSIRASLRIAVFNGALGIGNGMVIPSGPLREPVGSGLAQVDAAVITGDDQGVEALLKQKKYSGQIFPSRRHLNKADLKAISGQHVFAFAGIGHPEGFFKMLGDAGVKVTGTRSFADHHPYTPAELMAMTKQAQADGAMLVTTEKDYARLSPNDQAQVTAIKLETRLDGSLLDMVLKARV